MTALYIALGFLGGRAIRYLLDKYPTTKPGRGVSTGPRAPLPSLSNQFGSIEKGSRS